MRPENERMRAFLAANGIEATPKYIWDGSLRGTWRLYNHTLPWSPELAAKLTELGFTNFENRPFTIHSGNGGRFSVFVHGHDELLREPQQPEPWPKRPLPEAPEHSQEARDDENAAFAGRESGQVTDTERLDFWLKNSGYQPIQFRDGWGFSSGNICLGRGQDPRACIDDAIRNKARRNKAS